MTHKRKAAPVYGFKALDGTDGAEGTFEAIVAVFNNVDHVGDRILPGAFTDTLADWQASGDPIPVIFSHRWDDLDAHIGAVDEARELPPGADGLPAELAGLGGLYVKGTLDLDEEFAARVWRKLKRRTLREFSFAYDVIDGRTAEVDGEPVFDLVKLDLFEVGPTLKGANPATALLGAKARAAGKASAADLIDLIGEAADLEDVLDDGKLAGLLEGADVTVEEPPPAGDEVTEVTEVTTELEVEVGALELEPEVIDAIATGVANATAEAIRAALTGGKSAPGPAGDGTLAAEDANANADQRPRSSGAVPVVSMLVELDALELAP
jgi:HK97 family phage prohead protease